MCKIAFELALICWLGENEKSDAYVCLNDWIGNANANHFSTEGSSSTLALLWKAAPDGEAPENAVTYKQWSSYHFCKTIASNIVSTL